MNYFKIILVFAVMLAFLLSSCTVNINIGNEPKNQEEPSKPQSESSSSEGTPESKPEAFAPAPEIDEGPVFYGNLSFDDLIGDWAEEYETDDGEKISILFSFYYSEMNEPKIIFQYGKEFGETIAYYEGMVYEEDENLILELTLLDGTLFDKEGDGYYKTIYNFQRASWNSEVVIASSFGGMDIMPGYDIGFMELRRAYG